MNLFVLITFFVSVYYIDAQSICTTPNGSRGQCVLLTSCNKLYSLLSQSERPEVVALLRNSFCGMEGKAHKVCCEIEATTTKAPVSSYVPIAATCTSPRGSQGQCLPFTQCPEIRAIINNPNQTPAEADYAKRSFCGFDDRDLPKVCCDMSTQAPSTPDRVLTSKGSGSQPGTRVKDPVPLSSDTPVMEPCKTPREYDGDCIELTACPELYRVFTKTSRSKGENSFLRRSFCGYNKDRNPKVCCEILNRASSRLTSNNKPKMECMLNDDPPSPASGCCGRDGVSGNKITGGAPTNLDQYPWLALLEYEEGNTVTTLCGGTLISRRHVLTAAHCIRSRTIARRSLVNVRLGEYDTNSIIDGLDTEGGGEDFSDQLVIIAVESTVVHEGYNPDDDSKKHDIALIRLASAAPYTDFIRPVCLPTTDTTANPPSEYVLYAAGWGSNNETRDNNPVKSFVDLPYVNLQKCQSIYAPGTRRYVELWERQVCAGGEYNKDACKGDSGGPLMYENGAAYEIIGIISFGTDACGEEGVPGIYTKVFEYLDWIRTNMK